MNLILLTPKDFVSQTTVRLAGRRCNHVRDVLKSREGDLLQVGVLGGNRLLARLTRAPSPRRAAVASPRSSGGRRAAAASDVELDAAAAAAAARGEGDFIELEVAAGAAAGGTGGGGGAAAAGGLAGARCGAAAEEDTRSPSSPPPPKLPLTLVLAMPRPQVFNRILQTVATLGVRELALVGATRVEKSYWSSSVLHPENVEHQFAIGLEQAKDTVLPSMLRYDAWAKFAADGLPAIAREESLKLLAHPDEVAAPIPCPRAVGDRNTVLAVGPEGGWIPDEVALLRDHGFRCVTLGERILKTETAITALVSRLF